MLNNIFKTVGPLVVAAMAAKFENGEIRFDDGKFRFDSDFRGVTLDELDLTQDAPSKIMVFGSTQVRIVEGKTFRIKAEGGSSESLRFALENGKLAITRRDPPEGADGPAQIEIAMPAPRALALAGSGAIECNALAETAKVSVAGSGSIALTGISSEKLTAKLMGSGRLKAEGSVQRLKLAAMGSGSADLADLDAEKARMVITGSGSASLSSDGEVEAKMMGSGNVTVYGRAACRVQSIGSGRFVCRTERKPGDDDGGEPEAPVPPKPPKPPKSGGAAAKPKKPRKRSKPKKAGKLGASKESAAKVKRAKADKKTAGKRNTSRKNAE